MSLLVLLTGLFLLWASRFAPLQQFDDGANSLLAKAGTQGQRLLQGGHAAAEPAPVTLIAINDNSIANHPWPWTPLDYSLFVQAATVFKPELVAIDEVLDWDTDKLDEQDRRKLPQYERILRDSLLRCPKVLLGVELGWPEDPDAVPPVQGTPLLRQVKGNLREVPEWTAIAREPKEDFRLSAALGFTNFSPSGQTIYSAPLLLRYQGTVVPTLVLQAILLWQRLSPDDVSVVLGSHVAVGSNLRIPIDEHGEMRVNFAAPYTTMGFDDLLFANEQTSNGHKPTAPVDRLARSVALLGRTDATAGKMPLGSGQMGTAGELFAAAIATIQSKTFPLRAPFWANWVILAAAALVAFGVPMWKKQKVALWTAVIFLVYVLGALGAVSTRQVLLPMALPAGLALFILLYRLATPNNVWKLKRPIIF